MAVLLGLGLLGSFTNQRTFIYAKGVLIVALCWSSGPSLVPFLYFRAKFQHYRYFLLKSLRLYNNREQRFLDDVVSSSHLSLAQFHPLIGGMGLLVFALAIGPIEQPPWSHVEAEVPWGQFLKVVPSKNTAQITLLLVLELVLPFFVVLYLPCRHAPLW